MSIQTVFLTETDAFRLQKMLESFEFSKHDQENHTILKNEIARAAIVPSSEIPEDVVRMYSRVRIVDMRTGEQRVFQIVYPHEANYSLGKLSVLAPIGTALLGYQVGTEIEWRVPSGVRKLRIEAVEHQQEVASMAA
jgi:regulator of nucleoside diphosphate kinase